MPCIALVPLKTRVGRPEANFARFLEAARTLECCDLVVLPELSFTGYLYQEDDLERFAEPLDGPTFRRVAALARELGTGVSFGLIERTPRGFANTTVIVGKQGERKLVYRKISETAPFTPGSSVPQAATELGMTSVLVCGDLFTEEATKRLPSGTELLLVPMARAFSGRSPDRERWESEERAEYTRAVARLGVTAAVVNALDAEGEERSFGGAMIVGARGEVLAESPHGSDEPLRYRFDASPRGRGSR